ncbi:MAG: hypothetical protein ACREGC_04220 [Minisyncoccia bacterium]
MKEISQIGSTIWNVQEVPRGPFGINFNYIFFDPDSGEIWGKRIIVGAEITKWWYEARSKGSMDLRKGLERNGIEEAPIGILCALLFGKEMQEE